MADPSSERFEDAISELRPGLEILPGYRLVEPLGKGGFGEVWKCEAPGGFHKAIKSILQVDQDIDLSGRADLARKEKGALDLIRNIRHPFVLSVERVERTRDRLLIVMELADRNLAEVFRACRAKGEPGIPRQQLLLWLEEAAEALDLINFEHGLQHLDVKPHNLMVVANHLKVADFGLVNRVTRADGKTRIGGLAATPRYAAPEIFQGRVSRQSDQYSLAIVFQELLTGELPFKGRNARELLQQHLEAPPDLSALPPLDRSQVARALAKDPGQRFHRCRDFVRALLRTASWADMQLPDPTPSRPPADSPSGALPETAFVESTRRELPAASPPSRLSLADCRYLERIASYPLGEFWRVQAPTEEEWVVQHLHGFPVEEESAQLEALEALRNLRHPALLSFEIAELSPHRIILVYPRWAPTLLETVREQRLSVERLHEILAESAQALDDLTLRANLYHLALNPASVHLGPDGVLLRDFGLLARLWLPGQPHLAAFNPGFAAPELARQRPDRTADQFSLARIFLECAGEQAGFRDTRKESTLLLQTLPAAERRVLFRALDADPDKRFPTCTDFVRTLARATDEGRGTCTTNSQALHQAAMAESLHALQDWLDAQGAGLPLIAQEPFFPPRTLDDGSMEQRCFVHLLPGTSGLRLEIFRQEWNAVQSQRGEDDHLLFFPLERNFWQKVIAQETGIGLEVVCKPRPGGSFGDMEMVANLQIIGCSRKRAEKIRAELAPLIFADLRECMQAMADRRRRRRIPFTQPVSVRPHARGGGVELACTGKDLSHRGIGFHSSKPLSGQVRLVFTLPDVAEPILLDALIIRSVPLPDGRFEIGARFPIE